MWLTLTTMYKYTPIDTILKNKNINQKTIDNRIGDKQPISDTNSRKKEKFE
jgi:hypothetical protein